MSKTRIVLICVGAALSIAVLATAACSIMPQGAQQQVSDAEADSAAIAYAESLTAEDPDPSNGVTGSDNGVILSGNGTCHDYLYQGKAVSNPQPTTQQSSGNPSPGARPLVLAKPYPTERQLEAALGKPNPHPDPSFHSDMVWYTHTVKSDGKVYPLVDAAISERDGQLLMLKIFYQSYVNPGKDSKYKVPGGSWLEVWRDPSSFSASICLPQG